jgi:hypothetical protein
LLNFTGQNRYELKNLLVVALFTTSFFSINAQEAIEIPISKKKDKSFYISWGYNKDWFSKSDLHFSGPGTPDPIDKTRNVSYDFTVYDATAKDRPGFKEIFKTDLTIPQYVYRMGYFFNDKWGVEINFDHVKYVMNDYQNIRVKGTIHGQAIDQDTTISPIDFLHFEHTNGANFLMLNIMRRQQLLHSKNEKHKLNGIVKLGAGMVIPKTDVTLFGERVDNCFHIAGYCAGIEAGIRYEAYKYFFLEYTGKEVFSNYTKVLTIGPGKAHHHFWTFENILVLGVQVPF